MDKEKFAKRLAMLREERGFTQGALAEKTGLSRSAIGMYEQGRRTPDFDAVDALADCFDVNIPYMIGASNQRETYPRHEEINNTEDPILENEVRAVSNAYTKASTEIRAAVRAVLGVQR